MRTFNHFQFKIIQDQNRPETNTVSSKSKSVKYEMREIPKIILLPAVKAATAPMIDQVCPFCLTSGDQMRITAHKLTNTVATIPIMVKASTSLK